MTERITDAHLRGQVSIVNKLLGFDPDSVRWGTVGAIQIYGAYGATAVHRVVNTAGGVSDLSGLGTKREASQFLSGMIAALRITTEGSDRN